MRYPLAVLRPIQPIGVCSVSKLFVSPQGASPVDTLGELTLRHLNLMPVRYRALSWMFLLTLITYLDRVCISTTAETMQAELGLSKIQMGQVFSAFNLGYVLLGIPGGRWADLLGSR